MIEEEKGYPVEDQWFGYDPEFENDRTLLHFSITGPATLRLYLRKEKREPPRPKKLGYRPRKKAADVSDVDGEENSSDWEDVSEEGEEVSLKIEEGDLNEDNQQRDQSRERGDVA